MTFLPFSVVRRFAVVAAFCALATGVQAEKLLFRYTGNQGNPVLNDTLPPSAAGRGYEIIRADGTVVKTVEPAPPPEQAEAAKLKKENEEARRRWDESLLLRYSGIEDIEAAKERALSDIQIRISILKGNLNYLKTQVEREVFRAAEAERLGQEVSAAQKDAIDTLKSQVHDVEDLIAVRQQEKNETAARYDRDIERFATLQNAISNRQ